MKKPDATLSREEASDVLDRAGKIQVETEERLRVADVVEAGAEVGISPESVRKGIDQAKREQRAKEMSKHLARQRLRRWGQTLAALLVAASFTVLLLNATLAERLDAVEAARTQVHEAVQRQIEVRNVTRDEAELLGAENRVSIARRRYDRAARAYNALPAPRFGRPDRVPYSNEIREW